MEYDPHIARLLFSHPLNYLRLFDDAARGAHVFPSLPSIPFSLLLFCLFLLKYKIWLEQRGTWLGLAFFFGDRRKEFWRKWRMKRTMWLRRSSFTFELMLAALPLNALVCFFLCPLLVCHNSSFRMLMSSADWSCAYFCFLLHVIELETFPSIGRVRVQHRGILLTLKGIVIRSGAVKMHEGERMYTCHTCKNRCVRAPFHFFLSPFVICTERIIY